MTALAVNPFDVFQVMLDFGDTPAQQVTAIVVDRSTGRSRCSSPVSRWPIAFRMGLFNIGVEGQYRLATIVAAAAGAAVALPGPLHIAAHHRRGRCWSGRVWAGIVAVLKVTRGVSEVISSIMLNFIALGLASYLLTGPVPGQRGGRVDHHDDRRHPRVRPAARLNGIFGALGLAEPPRQLYGFLLIAIVVGVVDRRPAQPDPLRLRPQGERALAVGGQRQRRRRPRAWSSRRCCSPARSPG